MFLYFLSEFKQYQHGYCNVYQHLNLSRGSLFLVADVFCTADVVRLPSWTKSWPRPMRSCRRVERLQWDEGNLGEVPEKHWDFTRNNDVTRKTADIMQIKHEKNMKNQHPLGFVWLWETSAKMIPGVYMWVPPILEPSTGFAIGAPPAVRQNKTTSGRWNRKWQPSRSCWAARSTGAQTLENHPTWYNSN